MRLVNPATSKTSPSTRWRVRAWALTSIIAAFQQLTIALLMTKGGPLGSTYFFAMYIYDNAFKYFDMGYAAAGSWVMFIIVLALSLLVMRWSSAWVYYEGEVREKGGDRNA